jgi:hypothetical protein
MEMIGEEVARHRHPFVGDSERQPQEAHEEAQHLWIRVRELDGVPVPRALGPIEHAAGCVHDIALTGSLSAKLLLFPPALQSPNGVYTRPVDTPTHSATQVRALLVRQLDVPDP